MKDLAALPGFFALSTVAADAQGSRTALVIEDLTEAAPDTAVLMCVCDVTRADAGHTA